MPAQLGDPRRQACKHRDRPGVDFIVDTEIRMVREVRPDAGIPVSVAGAPHEDGLVSPSLRKRFDGAPEVVTQLLLTVLFDYS